MKDLYLLSEQQYGVVSRRQLAELGLTSRQIDILISSGRLRIVHRGIYRVAGSPRSHGQDLMAACLAAEPAAASHRSAGALWGLSAAHPTRPEILVEGPARRGLAGVII